MKKGSRIFASLAMLSSVDGDKERTIAEGEDSPEIRAELALHVIRLVRAGYFVSLADGTKIIGYNAETNEWITAAEKGSTVLVEAEGKPATAIPPVAGG
jgi:hypothetical protein